VVGELLTRGKGGGWGWVCGVVREEYFWVW